MADLRRVDVDDRNLRDMQDATQDALDIESSAPVYPLGKVVSVDRDYSSRFGEYVRVDTGSADVVINLPIVDSARFGQAVSIRKMVAGNTLKLVAANGSIDGASELSISAIGWHILIARDGGWDALS